METKEIKNILNKYLEEIENYWRSLWHRSKDEWFTCSTKRNRITWLLE